MLEVGSPPGLTVTTSTPPMPGAVVGTGTGTTPAVECPSGSAVTSFTGQVDSGGFLRNVTLECSPVTIMYSPPDHYAVAVAPPTGLDAGATGGSNPLMPFTATCPPNDVASGISATGGGFPVLYGLQCAPLAPPPP